MKKPVEAIERMRACYANGHLWDDSVKVVLAYLDSLKPWPADLTRERLMELAIGMGFESRSDALRRLAELAPEREKRMVNLWSKGLMNDEEDIVTREDAGDVSMECKRRGWRKVGGPFEVED